jgi:hypothetical protein
VPLVEETMVGIVLMEDVLVLKMVVVVALVLVGGSVVLEMVIGPWRSFPAMQPDKTPPSLHCQKAIVTTEMEQSPT